MLRLRTADGAEVSGERDARELCRTGLCAGCCTILKIACLTMRVGSLRSELLAMVWR